MTRLIKEAAASNAWLIFYTHDVDKQSSKYGCTPGLLKQLSKPLLLNTVTFFRCATR